MKTFLTIMIILLSVGILSTSCTREIYKPSTFSIKKNKPRNNNSYDWFATAEVGAAWSHTDVSKYSAGPDFDNTNANVIIGFGRQFTLKKKRSWENSRMGSPKPLFSVYGNIEIGSISGEKVSNGDPWYFKSNYYGGNLNGGINLSNLINSRKDRIVDFGLHAGVGLIHWERIDFITPVDDDLSTSDINMQLPIGVNVNFNISDKFVVYVDYSHIFISTDNIDGVNRTYPEPPPMGVYTIAGTQPIINDVYSHFNVGLRYKFGRNKSRGLQCSPYR